MRNQGKLSRPVSSARRQIAPPPVSQHLHEFALNPDAWAILARNLIPVLGIYALGWSAALAVFNYWFDGFTALAAIITVMVPRAMRETRVKSDNSGLFRRAFAAVLTWVALIAVVGLPYWIVLIPLHDMLLGHELRHELASSPGLWCAFGSLAAGHVWKALRAGYDTLPDRELTQKVRWDVYLLILRAVAMFMMATNGFVLFMVPLMALLLTYFELWPGRAIGAVFGDPTKLYEYDPEKDRR